MKTERSFPKKEKVLHGFNISREISAKLRVISIIISKNSGKNVSMTMIVDTALEEYFTNHKEEFEKEELKYKQNGGFLKINAEE